jgi:ATP-binding cassette, subfamily B, bacterial HlyB/CyaB
VQTINQLKGNVTMVFIVHHLPQSLTVDAVFKFAAQASDKVVPTTPTA